MIPDYLIQEMAEAERSLELAQLAYTQAPVIAKDSYPGERANKKRLLDIRTFQEQKLGDIYKLISELYQHERTRINERT